MATAWLLSRIEDRAGNAIRYRYNKWFSDTAVGPQGYETSSIRAIEYTAFGSHPGSRKVTFVYGLRPEGTLRYGQFGPGNIQLERLEKITTWINATPVKTYALQYREGGDPLIERVWECPGADTPPLDEPRRAARPAGFRASLVLQWQHSCFRAAGLRRRRADGRPRELGAGGRAVSLHGAQPAG